MTPPHSATDNSSPAALLRIDALAAIDAPRSRPPLAISPASVLVECDPSSTATFHARLLAIGSPDQVSAHEAARSPRLRTLSRPRSILIPGLVNAHTHLDLTHIGPQPHDPSPGGGGFLPWIEMIRTRREADPGRIAASVRQGIALSLAAGTVAIGDIAGAPRGQITLTPWQTLRQSPLVGVSWLEFFGIAKGLDRAAAMLDEFMRNLPPESVPRVFAALGDNPCGRATTHDPLRVRLGLQPHAPNTVAPSLYRMAAAHALRFGHAAPISTHLAESPEERRFIAQGTGPQRQLLESLGLWDDSALAYLGQGRHPIEHLADILGLTPFTVAHVNDAPDSGIATLAATYTRVVYCPHASTYFGAEHHFGPHRYRDMLRAGITVALGTDSLVNLPSARPGRALSILEEMRFLHARDRTNPTTLLRMATTNGAIALGLDPAAFAFAPADTLAGLVAVPVPDPAPRTNLHHLLLATQEPPELLFASTFSDTTALPFPVSPSP